MKKYFILSDIHSQYDLLLAALDGAGFDIGNPTHVLIIAGDVLDRGDQGDSVIRLLELLIKRERLLGVIGNHDVYLINILNQVYDIKSIIWAGEKNGFYKTLDLGKNKASDILGLTEDSMDNIRLNFLKRYPIFCNWIRNLPIYLEFKYHVIVHAFLDFSLDDWRDTSLRFATWERRYTEKIPETFTKNLIFGHTPNIMINHQNDIIVDGKKIMIDGGAAGGYQINVLVLDENTI